MFTSIFVKVQCALINFVNDERGVTAIEYGLIGVAMAVLLGTALDSGGFIGELSDAFARIASEISLANAKAP